jgi:hypothetical protein
MAFDLGVELRNCLFPFKIALTTSVGALFSSYVKIDHAASRSERAGNKTMHRHLVGMHESEE